MTSSSTRPLTLIVRKISVRQNCPNALELIGGGDPQPDIVIRHSFFKDGLGAFDAQAVRVLIDILATASRNLTMVRRITRGWCSACTQRARTTAWARQRCLTSPPSSRGGNKLRKNVQMRRQPSRAWSRQKFWGTMWRTSPQCCPTCECYC